MPVLARTIEEAGISTVTVTMMPVWSERIGVPRTLGVSFPFGHTLGHAGDAIEQRAVVEAALGCLQDMENAGLVEDLDIEWADFDSWRRRWQPREPSPIVKQMMGGG